MWGARFEWGSLGQHRLALGIRRFDPLIVRPSPWAKEPRFIDTERSTRMEVEALDRWLGQIIANDRRIRDPMWGLVSAPPQVLQGKDLHFGDTLFNNIWTYEDMKERQDEERNEEAFGFVVIQRFIRDQELERLREMQALSLPQHGNSAPQQQNHTGQALASSTAQASSSALAGPPTAAGPQVASSSQAPSSSQAGPSAQPGLVFNSSSTIAAGPPSQP
ncbi:MAT1-1-4 [Lasiodiplodia theobromae]|nr:MAT1-1-4 [Lasiodiplodia theobromae]